MNILIEKALKFKTNYEITNAKIQQDIFAILRKNKFYFDDKTSIKVYFRQSYIEVHIDLTNGFYEASNIYSFIDEDHVTGAQTEFRVKCTSMPVASLAKFDKVYLDIKSYLK